MEFLVVLIIIGIIALCIWWSSTEPERSKKEHQKYVDGIHALGLQTWEDWK